MKGHKELFMKNRQDEADIIIIMLINRKQTMSIQFSRLMYQNVESQKQEFTKIP